MENKVHCAHCNLHFPDVEARGTHVESSSKHPSCEPCGRRFLNEHSLRVHLECASTHRDDNGDGEEDLHGDDVLLAWSANSDESDSSSFFEDYWSSESEMEMDSSSSATSDSGSELDSERDEGDSIHNDGMIFLAGSQPDWEYRDMLLEKQADGGGRGDFDSTKGSFSRLVRT
ncbi:hypothetical protein FB45DRAFT_1056143 [Roridomyces roridus]|uniref:C2H2-type domain-containing protein n=1 Tax=Roridomyces roridus TaxID=1738132 RepID=A0AAD7C2F9_9AGAR|nr:hypothetical protein FB45DRAFT_1056143 [Roridomyces roridus]